MHPPRVSRNFHNSGVIRKFGRAARRGAAMRLLRLAVAVLLVGGSLGNRGAANTKTRMHPRAHIVRQERHQDLPSGKNTTLDCAGLMGGGKLHLVKKRGRRTCVPGVTFGCIPDKPTHFWVQNCRGRFRCGESKDAIPCGFPMGLAKYTCACSVDPAHPDPFAANADFGEDSLSNPD